MTKSEDIKARAARYNRIQRVDDSLGRVIGIKRLKPSQQIYIQELAPGLDGDTMSEGGDGKMFAIPKIAPLMMAAHVVEIDGAPITFPKSRAELNAVIDELDGEGLEAVGKALSQLSEAENAERPAVEQSVEDMAKN